MMKEEATCSSGRTSYFDIRNSTFVVQYSLFDIDILII